MNKDILYYLNIMIHLCNLLTDIQEPSYSSDLSDISDPSADITEQKQCIQNSIPESTECANLVEIYIKHNKSNPKNVIDICISDKMINLIYSKYKNFKTTKYICYYRNELCYVYDLTDDNQYVYSKLKKKDNTMVTKQREYELYMISYKLSKLPTHLFPCLNDIDHVVEYTLSEYKFTNRLSLIIRKDKDGQYLYIEYRHSTQMDIEKIDSNINHIINNIFT